MNLIIDEGNTQVKIALFDNNVLKKIKTISISNKEDISKILHDTQKINHTIFCSVGSGRSFIENLLKQNYPNHLTLNYTTPLPIINLYRSKETLGYDRIASVVGANLIFPLKNILIIDAGSAITYDIINKDSEYLGGNISPGLKMRFGALHHFTENLPLIKEKKQFSLYGETTYEAISSGVMQGTIFEIDGMIDSFRKKFDNLHVILTGGYSNFFDKKLKNSIFVQPNLVLKGLNRILEYNVKKD